LATSIYIRQKNAEGKWRYQRVQTGPGRKTAHVTGPFFFRPTVNGKQIYSLLRATTVKEAEQEISLNAVAIDAAKRGLTVAEADALANLNRVPIRKAVNDYLYLKRNKSPRTATQYARTLNEFAEAVKARFLDEITEDTLREYLRHMDGQGYAGKTIDTRLNIVYFLLKKSGIKVRLPKDEMPVVEEAQAVPYTDEELKKLFAAIDKITTGTTRKRANAEIVNGKTYSGEGFGAAARFRFFLGTAARDKEVTHAAWSDIDFGNRTCHIRGKKDVGFTIKNHEDRTVPIPDGLVSLLKARKKNAPHDRWIFVNEDGQPDNHFLRKLKVTALRGGLNCGQCKTTITKGRYDKKHEVQVTCKTDPVCEHWILHRFRKTCATRWHEKGIPVRTIQQWLGHKDLETTQRYLGVTPLEKVRDSINEAYGD